MPISRQNWQKLSISPQNWQNLLISPQNWQKLSISPQNWQNLSISPQNWQNSTPLIYQSKIIFIYPPKNLKKRGEILSWQKLQEEGKQQVKNAVRPQELSRALRDSKFALFFFSIIGHGVFLDWNFRTKNFVPVGDVIIIIIIISLKKR